MVTIIKIKYIERLFELANKCAPILEVSYDTPNEIPNLKKIVYKEPNIYLVNFYHGFFDSLEDNTIKILDIMFEKLDTDQLIKENWEKYMLKISGDDIGIYDELSQPNFYCILTSPNSFVLRNKRKNNSYKLIYTEDIDLENINNIAKTHKNDGTMIDYYLEDTTETEKDALKIFLHMIFTSDFNYKIIKCKNCGKYFVINKNATSPYCLRLYKNNMCCYEFGEYLKDIKTHSGHKNIDKLRQRIYEKEKFSNRSTDFIDAEEEMLKKYYDNNSEKVKFYLNYYIKNEDRERNIKELKLEEYLK